MFDKNDQEISQLIDSSLAAVLSGEASLEQVLAAHPDYADLLKPEIEAALWLVSRRDQVAPRPGFIAASRGRVIGRIQQEASSTGAKHGFFGFLWPKNIAYQWIALVLALVIGFTGASGLVSYSQSAIPGEGLYPVKRASEKIQYSLTVGELRRVEVSADFTSRRLQEFVTLVQQGKIESLEPSLETFEEHVAQTVELLEETSDAQPEEKKLLADDLQKEFIQQASKLNAIKEKAPAALKSDVERARTLTVLSASAAYKEGASVVTPVRTPTRTPTRTKTRTPVPSSTPTPTRTRTRVPTDTPTNTLVPPIIPTSTDPPPTNTDAPTSTLTPTVTDTPTSTNTPEPTSTVAPTSTPVPTFTPTSTLTPTDTITPTGTSSPMQPTGEPESSGAEPTNPVLPTSESTQEEPLDE